MGDVKPARAASAGAPDPGGSEDAASIAARYPTRVAILYELLKARDHNPATVTELASQFGLSQPTVSVHVKLLREAGLVRSERDGNQVLYHAEEETIRAYVEDALGDVLQRPESAEPRVALPSRR